MFMSITRFVPGLLLCVAIALAAFGLQVLEEHLTGRAWLEALVIAILLGTVVRTLWTPGARFAPGIGFSAKTVLEVAVVLLGASISFHAVMEAGFGLIAGIALVVAIAIVGSYLLCRALGLPKRMAVLVACGNSICGNSAIAAVAPVIRARPEDIASSIAFTAILGVVVVIALPLFVPALALSETQYGVLAGLTVYAVPQVLAATVPVGLVSTQLGTLVKLVRVLMLGPVVIALSLLAGRGEARLSFSRMVPWFIIGFLALAAFRSAGAIPDPVLRLVMPVATGLTVVAMAALGLGVDLKVLARVGGRVTVAVTLSLVVLVLISLILIRVIGIP